MRLSIPPGAVPMTVDLRKHNFLKPLDFTAQEIDYLLDLACVLKAAKRVGEEQPRLSGRNIALIFEKGSTRTRCAVEVATHDQAGKRMHTITAVLVATLAD
jgi:ornithine carbamoyltransferase